MIDPRAPVARSPVPSGPAGSVPSAGRRASAVLTSGLMCSSCQRISSSTALGLFWRRQAGGFRGIGGRTQGVCSHMGDTGGLCGCSRSCHCDGGGHIPRGAAGHEPSTDLADGSEFAATEGTGPRDGVSRAVVVRSFLLEQAQYSLGTVRRPHRDKAPIGFTESLRRRHANIISGASGGGLQPSFALVVHCITADFADSVQ